MSISLSLFVVVLSVFMLGGALLENLFFFTVTKSPSLSSIYLEKAPQRENLQDILDTSRHIISIILTIYTRPKRHISGIFEKTLPIPACLSVHAFRQDTSNNGTESHSGAECSASISRPGGCEFSMGGVNLLVSTEDDAMPEWIGLSYLQPLRAHLFFLWPIRGHFYKPLLLHGINLRSTS